MSDFRSGDVVAVRFAGVLQHYGVVTSRGTVISNSQKHGGVVEQSLKVFANGKSIRRVGRQSDLDGHHVENRARRRLGADYDLAGSNCIDFIRQSHRQRPTPWQVGKAALMAFGDMRSNSRKRW